MKKYQLTKKRKRQLVTMFALAGVAASNATGSVIALADTIKVSDNHKAAMYQDQSPPSSSDLVQNNLTGASSETTADQAETNASTTEATQTTASSNQETTATTSSTEKDVTKPTTAPEKEASKAAITEHNDVAEQPKVQAEDGVLAIEHKTSGGLLVEIAIASNSVDPAKVKTLVITGTASLNEQDWKILRTMNSLFLPNITGLTLENSDTSIPDDGLANASWLKTLTAEKVTTVGNKAFSGVTNLQSVNLGITATTRLAALFSDSQNSITSFTLNNVKETPDLTSDIEILLEGFQRFSRLSEVNMENVTSIGESTFCYVDSLKTINCPKIDKVGPWAFFSRNNNGSLTDLSGLSHVKQIKHDAFSGQAKFQKIDFPNTTTVDDGAFYSFTGKEVNLPNVQTIDNNAFHSAANITKVNLGITDTPQLATLFNPSKDSLTSLTLNNVKETSDGGAGFASFSKLSDVTMNNITKIGDGTFQMLESLSTVYCPKVDSIGAFAFFHTSLTDTKGLSHATKIGKSAFYGTAKLTTVDFPNVTDIAATTFVACVSLTEVNLPNAINIDPSAFWKNIVLPDDKISKVTLGITDTTQLAAIFEGSKDSITSLTLNNVTKTPDLASEDEASSKGFASFTKLNDLNMPNLVDVGAFTFHDAAAIPKTAFDHQDAQGNEVPGTVQTIGAQGFSGIKNQAVVKASQLTALDNTAFKDSSVKVLLLPQGNIPEKYFTANPGILGIAYGDQTIEVPVELDAKASFGQENIFNVDTSGVATTYQWTKDGEVLNNTLPIYEIAHFTPKDSGTYTQAVQFTINNTKSNYYKAGNYHIYEMVQPARTPELQPVYDTDTALKGSTSPNAEVYLTDENGDSKLATAPSDDEGQFTLELPERYAAGTTLYVKAHTEAGDSDVAHTVVREAVQTPTVDPIIEGDTTVTGIGKTDNQILVSDGVKELGHTTVKDGKFEVTIPTAKAGDQYKVYAKNAENEQSDAVPVKVEVSQGTITLDPYHVGDVNVTGTYTGTVASIHFSLDGKYINRGGTFKDGKFTYYCGAGKIKVGNTAKFEAFDRNDKLLDTKILTPEIEHPATIKNAVYKIGTSQITGNYEGDVKKAKLTVNGKVVSWGGTFANGNMSYYVKPGTIKAGDTVTIQAYDQYDSPLSGQFPVAVVNDVTGTITRAVKKLGSTMIEGTYEGNIAEAKLEINNKVISYGGTFKDGTFSYYFGKHSLKDTDVVTLTPLDVQKNPIGEPVTVEVEKGTAKISNLTYKLGTTQITGNYEGVPTEGELLINGKSINFGGTFVDGKISYYVKAGVIQSVKDEVAMNFFDEDGNLIQSEVPVTIQAK